MPKKCSVQPSLHLGSQQPDQNDSARQLVSRDNDWPREGDADRRSISNLATCWEAWAIGAVYAAVVINAAYQVLG